MRPTISSKVRNPSDAISSRASAATNRMNAITCSGFPANRARRRGSCVATPTGQVLRWHLRIMTHPSVTSATVPKPNSSAPSSAAITTSRPVRSCPSTCTRIRSRRRLSTRVCCVSARPISHGMPACLIELIGELPVPPSWPLTSTMSARPLATPAATVPTPTSATSFTDTRASGLAAFRS